MAHALFLCCVIPIYKASIKLCHNSITDMYVGGSSYWPGNIMVRCGTGPLGTYSGTQVIEGQWDAEEQMVMVPSSAEEGANLVASPTQYWAVRDTAMRLLYVAANSALMANGNRVPLKAFADGTQPEIAGGFGTTGQEEIRKTVDGFTVGVEVADYGIGLTEEQAAQLVGDVTVTYSVAEGTLPAGLSLNASTGAITGTPTVAGEYNITFRATVDRYLTVDKLLKFVVATSGDGQPSVEDQLNDANATIADLQAKIDAMQKEIDALKNTEGGCGSSVASVGIVAGILAIAFVGAVAIRAKKKEK